MARLPEALERCFPAEGPIWAYMQWAHRLSHTPPILHLASIIPVMSYELCRRGFTIPEFGTPRAWFGVVAASSVAKTSTLSRARDFSQNFYSEHFVHESIRPKPWVSLEGSLPGVLHAISGMQDDKGRTAGILYHNEFSRVLRSEDALEPLNMIYDGNDLDRNLRYLQKQQDQGSNVSAVIKQPSFSAVVTTTPSAMERVARADMLEGGLFQRMLWVRCGLTRSELQPRPLSDPTGKRYVMDTWANWFGIFEAHRLRGLVPTIAFEPAALQWLDSVFESLGDLIVRETFESGVAIRATHHATGLAAVYAASRNAVHDGQIWVGPDDVFRAVNLVAECLGNAQKLGGQLFVKTMSLSSKSQHLLNCVKDRDVHGCTRREVYELFHRHVGKVEMELIIATLIEMGLIVEQVAFPKSGPGRPSKKLYTPDAWRRASGTNEPPSY